MREDCKAFILRALKAAEGAVPTAKLAEAAKSVGYSFTSLQRAKRKLREERTIQFFQTGRNKDRT